MLSWSADLENDSDTEKTSSMGSPRKRLLSRRETLSSSTSWRRPRTAEILLIWLRWGAIAGLQLAIIGLLLLRTGRRESNATSKVVETGDDINGLYKTCHSTELRIARDEHTELTVHSIAYLYVLEARRRYLHSKHDDKQQ
jgi:hypothetical protein